VRFGAIIAKVADLVEAEGRLLRESSVQVGLAITLALAAALLGVAGLSLISWGLFEALRSVTGVAGAALISGAFLLASAGGIVWTAIRIGKGD
jgi:hypothetical protein